MAKKGQLTAKEAKYFKDEKGYLIEFSKSVWRRFLIRKLGALNSISKHMGYIAASKTVRPSEKEYLKRRGTERAHKDIKFSLIVLCSPIFGDIAKTAVAGILDYYSGSWRKVAGNELIGEIIDRNSIEVLKWKQAVLKRDYYMCCKCENKKKLHAHHIVRWADSPRLRLDVDNGQTLCEDCHAKAH